MQVEETSSKAEEKTEKHDPSSHENKIKNEGLSIFAHVLSFIRRIVTNIDD